MHMSEHCFVKQIAEESILLRVTNVCSECYKDFEEGEVIYYDMLNCRYVCKVCQDELAVKLDEDCEIREDDGDTLF